MSEQKSRVLFKETLMHIVGVGCRAAFAFRSVVEVLVELQKHVSIVDREGVCSILNSRTFKRPRRYPCVSDFSNRALEMGGF